jgi:hypothetical protein
MDVEFQDEHRFDVSVKGMLRGILLSKREEVEQIA